MEMFAFINSNVFHKTVKNKTNNFLGISEMSPSRMLSLFKNGCLAQF
jgi:hypothetical protein